MNLAVMVLQLILGIRETRASTAVASCFWDFSPQPLEKINDTKTLIGWYGKCFSKPFPCSDALYKNIRIIDKHSKLLYYDNSEAHLNNSVAAENILNYFATQTAMNLSEKDFDCLYFNRAMLEHETCEYPGFGNAHSEILPDPFSCVAYFWELPGISDESQFVWQNKCSQHHPSVKCSASLLGSYLSLTKINKEASNATNATTKIVCDIGKSLQVNSSTIKTEACINFNLEILEQHIQKHKHEYEMGVQRTLWTKYLISPLLSVMLILGIAGNAALLIIIVIYPGTRNLYNTILRHVVIADLTTLGYYSIILYSSFNGPVPFNKVGCYFIITISNMATGVSQYAMVMLSAIRYLAVKSVPGSREDQLLYRFNKTPVLQIALWILAIVASTPHISCVYYNHEMVLCAERNSLVIQYADFACFCLVPLFAISVFSIRTTAVLRRSVSMVPQSTGEECSIRNRLNSARILVALVVVFCVSYFPFSVMRLIYNWDMARLYYIAMVLRPLNAVLNPWAVCLASRAFKKHLLCQQCNFTFLNRSERARV